MVRGTVCTHQTTAIQTEHHVQILDGHVMDDLVVRPLHEARVNVAEGHEATGGHARAERHSVLLGNAHVKRPVGHLLHHVLQAAS